MIENLALSLMYMHYAVGSLSMCWIGCHDSTHFPPKSAFNVCDLGHCHHFGPKSWFLSRRLQSYHFLRCKDLKLCFCKDIYLMILVVNFLLFLLLLQLFIVSLQISLLLLLVICVS